MSNTSHHSSSEPDHEELQYVDVLLCLGVVMALGCIGNAIVSYIYFVKLKRTDMNLFVAKLSFCDSFGSLVGISMDMIAIFLPAVVEHDTACTYIQHIIKGVVVFLAFVMFVVYFVEFKNAILSPQCENKKYHPVYLSTAINYSILCLPCFYVYSTLSVISFNLGIDGRHCFLSEQIKGRSFYIIFLFLVNVPVLMLFCTIYCLVGIMEEDRPPSDISDPSMDIPKVRAQTSKQVIKRLSSGVLNDEIMPNFHSTVTIVIQQQHYMYKARITFMMSMVSLCWLVCLIPHSSELILLAILPRLKDTLGYRGHIIFGVGMRLYYAKNAATPWIYGIIDYNFRGVLMALFKTRLPVIRR